MKKADPSRGHSTAPAHSYYTSLYRQAAAKENNKSQKQTKKNKKNKITKNQQ